MVKPRKRIDEGKDIRRKVNIGPEFQVSISDWGEAGQYSEDESELQWSCERLKDMDRGTLEDYLVFAQQFTDHENSLQCLASHDYDAVPAKRSIELSHAEKKGERRVILNNNPKKLRI